MEWSGLVNTAFGVLVGTSAFADGRRWLLESAQRAKDRCRGVQVAFPDATARASETLVNTARGRDHAENASARAATVPRDSSLLSRRRELSLVAEDHGVAEVTEVVTLLRDYRDIVARGLPYQADEVHRVRAVFNARRDRLTRVMRESPVTRVRPADVLVTASSPAYTPLDELGPADAGWDVGGRLATRRIASHPSRRTDS